jgi:transposase-like protein
MITKKEKERIITEKLTSRISYRDLAKKHNLCFQTLHQWVNVYQGKMRNRKKVKDSVPPPPPTNNELAEELLRLKEELRKSQLLNEVLTEVINVAEEKFQIPIRKKSGAK